MAHHLLRRRLLPALQQQQQQQRPLLVIMRGLAMKTDGSLAKEPLVLSSTSAGVRTLTMNNPRRFNAWTQPMLEALKGEFVAAAEDDDVGVVVLTGKGRYYCAGVDLSAILKPMHPQTLHDIIYEKNRSVFDAFLDFPKPLIAAVQGPAIGASVTTATLCDALVMGERATLSTPFARLSVPPEGCSSVHFPRVMGDAAAQRMLGDEAWAPTAAEALSVGLAHQVVATEGGSAGRGDGTSEDDEADEAEAAQVVAAAQSLGEAWIADGRVHRSLPGLRGGAGGGVGEEATGAARAGTEAAAARAALEEYKGVNDSESQELARQFLGPGFLQAQIDFLSSKGKSQPAMAFRALLALRPLWAMLLKDHADVARYEQK